ncbi:MAG: hypothetical protein EPN37_10415, partial [Chitinophagaceae bacterium]
MKKSLYCVALFILITGFGKYKDVSGIRITDEERPVTTMGNSFYVSNKAPLQASSFIRLPIGSIEPGGWVLECLKREKN